MTRPLLRDEWNIYYVRWLRDAAGKEDSYTIVDVVIEKINALLAENDRLKELLKEALPQLANTAVGEKVLEELYLGELK